MVRRHCLQRHPCGTRLVGQLIFAEANGEAARGNFGSAAETYEEAADFLKVHVNAQWFPEAAFLRAFARVSSPMMRGVHQQRFGASAEAMQLFQTGQARLKSELVPVIGRLEAEGNDVLALRIQLTSLQLPAFMAIFVDDLIGERFGSAFEQAKSVVAFAEGVREDLAEAELPEEVKSLNITMMDGIAAVGRSFALFAKAELARVERRWAEAESGYTDALNTMKSAGQEFAAIEDMPLARDMQTLLLNTRMIEIARNRCRENRNLVEEIEANRADANRWREAMNQVRAPVLNATIIGATAQSSADVNSIINNAVNIAEDRVMECLDRIESAVTGSSLPEGDKARVAREIADIKSDKREGGSRFARVAEFIKSCGEIVGGVKEAAEPLAEAAKSVAPYLAAAFPCSTTRTAG